MTVEHRDKKQLVAVYGTLRTGQRYYNQLLKPGIDSKSCKFLCEMETLPIYKMYSLHKKAYPAVLEGGVTSIKIEIFSVDSNTLERLNLLEGYTEGNKNNLYNTINIATPYGNAIMYVYNEKEEKLTYYDCRIKHGDWVQFIKS